LSYGSIPEPVYTDFTQTGWAYDSAGAVEVEVGDLITGDDTLFAVWEAD